MEEILSRLALPDSDLPSLLAELVARLRPDDAGDWSRRDAICKRSATS